MLAGILSFSATLFGLAAAQSSPAVVCIAGQCLQGYTNITIGAKLSAPGAPAELLLLPGQYTSTTNPQLLHDLLTSSSASLKPSPGFENATLSLPLDLQLSPGFSTYSESGYAGQVSFVAVPDASSASNTSTPLSAKSLALSQSVRVTLSSGQNRLTLWESVPDVSQLPNSASLSVSGIESSACNPSCSAAGICSATGTCVCQPGFTGASCEECEAGHFGPTCGACPTDCDKCDEGISGSGRCLTTSIPNAPATCNCVNGVCGTDGSCKCNDGWTTGDDGKACGKCDAGFFLTPTGDCKVCKIGCTSCADGTGLCTTCKTGFTRDQVDQTKCNKIASVNAVGVPCPEIAFSADGVCQTCVSPCKTCTGPTSNDCVLCIDGQYMFNGSCVPADSKGVCQGSTRIANNGNLQCDSCGAKCTSCGIAQFSGASTEDQVQCTGCIPGTFLSQGKCVDACPAGQFPDPKDNLTCIPCDAGCATCSGSADFCLTCPTGQLTSNGKCVSSCPSTSFPSTTSAAQCQQCHPDCATCSGGSAFNQCLTCPPERPVLANGRCLPTCEKGQYLESTSGKCQSCDPSCSSCSGPGQSNCLACSSSSQILKSGSCVAANCGGATEVIPGLGVCFNQLVVVPTPSGSATPSALPTITGLSAPVPVAAPAKKGLEWWQILLMALGCAFIFLVFLMCWRRRARKRRAQRTAAFAKAKAITPHGMARWKWHLVRLGERMFGHKHNNAQARGDIELGLTEQERERKLIQAKLLADAKYEQDMDRLIDSYQRSLKRDWSRSSRAPTTQTKPNERPEGSLKSQHVHHHHHHDLLDLSSDTEGTGAGGNGLPSESLYSQVTGVPRRGPEAKQPVRDQQFSDLNHLRIPGSRFSESSWGSSYYHRPESIAPPPKLTDAQSYVDEIRPTLYTVPQSQPQKNGPAGGYWLEQTPTGASNASSSKNPFRQPTKPF